MVTKVLLFFVKGDLNKIKFGVAPLSVIPSDPWRVEVSPALCYSYFNSANIVSITAQLSSTASNPVCQLLTLMRMAKRPFQMV